MSMDEGFRKMLAGVKQADEGRDEVELAWAGRKTLEEQIAELRDSVEGLQLLVMEQSRRIAELRERSDNAQ